MSADGSMLAVLLGCCCCCAADTLPGIAVESATVGRNTWLTVGRSTWLVLAEDEDVEGLRSVVFDWLLLPAGLSLCCGDRDRSKPGELLPGVVRDMSVSGVGVCCVCGAGGVGVLGSCMGRGTVVLLGSGCRGTLIDGDGVVGCLVACVSGGQKPLLSGASCGSCAFSAGGTLAGTLPTAGPRFGRFAGCC